MSTSGLIAALRRKAVFFKRHVGANETYLLLNEAADALSALTREMHSRELHHFESERKLEELQALTADTSDPQPHGYVEQDAPPVERVHADIRTLVKDLDIARHTGELYTYGQIQRRLMQIIEKE